MTSLKSMGFKDIFMVADSGGNTQGMTEIARELNAKWMGRPARVYYIPEYYDESIAKLVENGKQLAEYRATITVNAMKKAQEAFAGQ